MSSNVRLVMLGVICNIGAKKPLEKTCVIVYNYSI